MKILVTGGCGFIGSHIVESLLNNNLTVFVIDNDLKWIKEGVKYYDADINNRDEINEIITNIKPDICIHMAGILGTTETWNYIDKTVNTNINGANNVYEICGMNKCDIITVDVGSRWLSPYTITKTCSADFALALANKYDIKCGLLRIFNVYGPRQSTKIIKIAPMFIYNSLKDNNLEIWGNKNTDLVYVTDVAEAFTLAALNLNRINKRRDIYIGSGTQLTTQEFAQKIINKIGKGKILNMKTRLGEENIESGHMDNDMAYKLLGWKPKISLVDGLNKTIDFYKEKDIVNNFNKF